MKFYVPSIGDKLYLLEPWTFTLHNEHRNTSLAKRMPNLFPEVERSRTYWQRKVRYRKGNKLTGLFGYTNYERVGPEPWEVPETSYHVRSNKPQEYVVIESCNEGDEHASPRVHTWKELDWSNAGTKVTLPAKTELVIDRIYIRKGNAAYDSITFYIEKCPLDEKFAQGKKKPSGGFGGKGRARFWVKLKDANRIVCQLTPVFDLEAPAANDRFDAILEED